MSPQTKADKFWAQILNGTNPAERRDDPYTVRLKGSAAEKIAIPEDLTAKAIAPLIEDKDGHSALLYLNMNDSFVDGTSAKSKELLRLRILQALLLRGKLGTASETTSFIHHLAPLHSSTSLPMTTVLPTQAEASTMLDNLLQATPEGDTPRYLVEFLDWTLYLSLVAKRTDDDAVNRLVKKFSSQAEQGLRTLKSDHLLSNAFFRAAVDWDNVEKASPLEKAIITSIGYQVSTKAVRHLSLTRQAGLPPHALLAGLDTDELIDLYKSGKLPTSTKTALASHFSTPTLLSLVPAGTINDAMLTAAFREIKAPGTIRNSVTPTIEARVIIKQLLKSLSDAEAEMLASIMNSEEDLKLSELLPAIG